VIGVQTEAMPAVYESWKARRPLALEGGRTFADGLATRVAFELTHEIYCRLVDDIRLVSEHDMRRAIAELLETGHVLAEGAGAAPLAAAVQERGRLSGRNVGLVLSGGNVDREVFARVLSESR
jgi:threonine dehydratase